MSKNNFTNRLHKFLIQKNKKFLILETLLKWKFRLFSYVSNKKFVTNIPYGKKCCVIIFHDYERKYGNKLGEKTADMGLRFILDVEKKYKIKATYNIVGKICENYPKSVLEIKKEGHEIADHTYEHITPSEVNSIRLKNSITKSKKAFSKLNIKIKGFRSPRSRWDMKLLKILQQQRFVWNAESDISKFPYYIKDNLLRIPIRFDDWGYIANDVKPGEMLNELKRVIKEGIKEKCYVAIGFHPWVEGINKERLKVFEEFIKYLSNNRNVVCLTFGEVADWCKNNH